MVNYVSKHVAEGSGMVVYRFVTGEGDVFTVPSPSDFRAGILDASGSNRMTETEAAEARSANVLPAYLPSDMGDVRADLARNGFV